VHIDYHRHNDPNYSMGGFDHPRGWRKTTSLKCASCGQSTRHALLPRTDREQGDWDEERQRIALGGDVPDGQYGPQYSAERVHRLRVEYREMPFPRNPYLHHWYVISEAQKAWDAGQRSVTALCGETMKLGTNPSTCRGSDVPMTELVEADEMRDMEYEDEETGLFWVDMQCVDCLRVTNGRRLARKRKELLCQLLEVSAIVDSLGPAELTALGEHVGRLMESSQQG
jgi:hypothetical protein